jgi:glycosyltransferase involved in cell wall biosynthesis
MFVYNNFLHDSRVQKEAETLTQAGYQVTVVALLDGQTLRREDRSAITVIRVEGCPWYRPLLSHPKGWGGNAGKGLYPRSNRTSRQLLEWIKLVFMPFHRQLCFLFFYHDAYKATGKEKYEIYHAHDLNTLPVAFMAARRDKAKLIYDSHELYLERNKLQPSSRLWKFVLRRLESFLARRSDAVLTVNETLAEVLVERYRIPRPCVVMNTPASLEQSADFGKGNGSLRAQLAIPSEAEVLIYVGGIKLNRGLEELILSLRYLEGCCLVCMGDGNEQYKKILMALAEQTGVLDRFFFFGPVSTEQVIHFAACADLGVAAIANTCMSYYYCSPNKLFEYMNAGLPVAASNFPELEKVVLGHDVGLTFDPSDPEDIARTARQILGNPEGRERMRKNAVRASRLYNWENESRKLLQVYDSLKTKSHPSARTEELGTCLQK